MGRTRKGTASRQGTVYPVIDRRTGYKSYRWRISWNGETWGPYSVGVRRGSTPRKQEENDRAAKAKAEAALRKLRARLEAGDKPNREAERRTVGQQVEHFLREVERVGRSPSTQRTYGSVWRNHVKDWPIAGIRLAKFTDDDLREHEHALKAAKRSDAVIAYVDGLLRSALRLRVGGKRLVDADMLESVEKPSVRERREGKPFTEAQTGLFFAHVAEGWRLFFLTLYFGALRWGEAAGVAWEDVNLEDGGILVRRKADKDTRVVEEVTKGKRSRWVPMPRDWCALVEAEHERLGRPVGLVFPADDGLARAYRDCRAAFIATLAAAGLPDDRRMHDLRHSWNAHARRAKVDPRTRADILGHASPQKLTDGTYSHVDPELGRDAVEAVAARVGLFGTRAARAV